MQNDRVRGVGIESHSRFAFDKSHSTGMRTGSVVVMGMMALAGAASAQSVIPDSQVEANVLKALAAVPELATQSISTNTVYGVVTLSGNVSDDAARTKADNLAATAAGVKKVVDQLQVGTGASPQNTGGMVLQSDGSYAPSTPVDQGAQATAAPGATTPAQSQRNDPEHDQALDAQTEQQQQQANAGQASNTVPPATQYPQQRYPAYPQASPQGGYPQQPGVPQAGYPQQAYGQPGYAQNAPVPYGGQLAGQNVTIPPGTMVRVRVNRLLASDKAKPGDHFDGTVANDVVAGGFVAIPRGAQVQGNIVDAHPSGAILGRGEMSIQLTSVTLSGKVYSLTSDTWKRSGPDKTGQTVGNAAGLGLAGAFIGAIAGRGAGAAIGAGVGTAAGIGASAASPRGQVVIPPEGMVSFNLAAPLPVQTVSEQEIQRLAYGAGPGNPGAYPTAYGYGRRPIYVQPYPVYYPPAPPPYGYPTY